MSKYKIVHITFIVLGLMAVVGVVWWEISYFILLILFFLWVSILTYGSFTMSVGFFVEAVYKFDTNEKLVAITFDDGPTEFTPEILQLLRKKSSKATFFCIGRQIEKHPDIFQSILNQGHSIGNHSYIHSRRMGFFSKNKVKEEIAATDRVIEAVSGQSTPYFRPPFGVTNPNIAQALKETGHRVVGWNNRSFDTFFKSEEFIFNRIIRKISPGSIILLHDTSEKTVMVVERLLNHLEQQGYRSVAIDEIIK